ncbi:hypothetical protein K438DRAFT_2002612 [Mycena galopus ATCC 62051]|nr:hypothetical protein K438DRAFT_2002612 [Mycena galopus ATCC 62051]
MSFRSIQMAQSDGRLGSMMIISWLASILYGVAMCKTGGYVASKKNPQFRKGLLVCCMVSCTLAMVGQLAEVYYPTVTRWGNTTAIHKQVLTRSVSWPHILHVIFNCCTGTVVDGFLIHRLHRLYKNMWITLLLGCGVGAWSLGAIISLINTISHDNKFPRGKTAMSSPISHSSLFLSTDIFITSAFIWKLHTLHSPSPATNSLIHRLIVGAIQTGSTTTTVAVAMLISKYADRNRGRAGTAFFPLIGPLYLLTLLYNLNLQPYDDANASSTGKSGSLTHPPLTHPPLTQPSFANPSWTVDICMDGVHVHRTTTVSVEPFSRSARSGTSRSFIGTKFQENSSIGPYMTPSRI